MTFSVCNAPEAEETSNRMKVKIHSQILSEKGVYARISTNAGDMQAKVLLGSINLVLPLETSAELDVNVTLNLNENAKYVEEETAKVVSSDLYESTLQLRVEGQDQDGMSYLRLSDDCLIMVEVQPRQFLEKSKFLQLRVSADDLQLTLLG